MTLYFTLLALSLLLAATVAAGGLLLEFGVSKVAACGDTNAAKAEVFAVRVFCYGVLWVVLAWAPVAVFGESSLHGMWWWPLLFAASTFAVLGAVIVACKAEFFRVIPRRHLAFLAALWAAALVAQIPSVLLFPHVMDCVQLGWTGKFVDPENVLAGCNTGAMAYSALISFVGLLSADLPLAVSAAAVKVLIYYLMFVVSLVTARIYYGGNFLFGALVCMVCLFGSYFGFSCFGLGKDSPLGVLLSAAYVAMLALPASVAKQANLALCCGVASILGVISVPFMAVAAACYFLLGRDVREKASLITWHCILALPMMLFPLAAMLKVSVWTFAAAAAVAFLVVLAANKTHSSDRLRWPSINPWLAAALVLVAFVVSAQSLPVLKVLPHTPPSVLAPLDGQTGFIALLFDYSSNSGFLVCSFLLAPFCALYLWRKQDPGGWAGFIYLQLALGASLLLCNVEQGVFDNHNLWDLVKDSVRWYLPFTAMMSLGPVCEKLKPQDNAWGPYVPAIAVVLGGSFLQCAALNHGFLGKPGRIGIFQMSANNRTVIVLADHLSRASGRGLCFIDINIKSLDRNSLEYFCPRTLFVPLPSTFRIPVSSQVDGLPNFVWAKRMALVSSADMQRLREANPHTSLTELATCASGDVMLVGLESETAAR